LYNFLFILNHSQFPKILLKNERGKRERKRKQKKKSKNKKKAKENEMKNKRSKGITK
jgi:hypothetical protein